MAARVHMGLGNIFMMQEKPDQALAEFEKALGLRVANVDETSRELAETYFTIGTTLLSQKVKEQEAVKHLQKSAAVLERRLSRLLNIPPLGPSEELKGTLEERLQGPLVQVLPTDSKEVAELKSVLREVYTKVLHRN